MQKKAKEKESKIKVQLLGDRVLVKPEEELKKTASGIIIPETGKQEKPTRGVIVAVGPGRMNDEGEILPMSVQTGQKVYFNPGWESELEVGEEKYYLIHESDIKAVIK
ncbi:MAG: co-chaperone GroES [bacterium]|nr:co-chaperone GroES [bacterium]